MSADTVHGVGQVDGSSAAGLSERRRRINFEQIQTAIKQMVNDASKDVRAQYGHLLSANAVNQSLLQRRVASELMVRLAGSGTQGDELTVCHSFTYRFCSTVYIQLCLTGFCVRRSQ